jgi:hypothetical protein
MRGERGVRGGSHLQLPASNLKLPDQAGVGEWLKPAVCKIAALTGYAGSNPAPGTITEVNSEEMKVGRSEPGELAPGAVASIFKAPALENLPT